MYVLIQRLTYVAVVKHIDFVLFSFSTFYVFDYSILKFSPITALKVQIYFMHLLMYFVH